MGLNVLSLFDGMSCGMIAFKQAGLDVDNYYAYEIDKYAIQTATHNFPMIKECGDVFEADFTQYSDIDYIVGGSPCTYWSIAQKNNRETEASGLGWELFSRYVCAVNTVKPKFFIYENNKSMSKAIRESITKTFGFEPICINSALVSAQNRQRLYWVGKLQPDGTYSKVYVEQPIDRKIYLRDIIEQVQSAAVESSTGCILCVAQRGRKNNVRWEQQYEVNGTGKTNTLTKVQKDNLVAEPVNIVNGKAQTLKAQYAKNSVANFCGYNSTYGATGVAEAVCMRYARDEDAKRLRKQYEAHEIQHGFREHSELHPRTDGKTNTLSTVLKDNPICEPVLILNTTIDGKSQCIRATCYKDGLRNLVANDVDKRTCVAEKIGYAVPVVVENGVPLKAKSIADHKIYDVLCVANGFITVKEKQYEIKLPDGYYIIRKLTVDECKQLQTVPAWYDLTCVSATQALKLLGNGWTVDVIVHLIKSCLTARDKIDEV